ncbi:MAG: hypothetical protein AB1806_15355 [Acidobacteriota bacterium]
MSLVDLARTGGPAPIQFRVLGPESRGPSFADLRRLFPGQRLTGARRVRVSKGGRILAVCGTCVVGLAAYEQSDNEIRVFELGVDPQSACGTDQIAGGLLDALELACMAAGARRLLLLPRARVAGDLLRRRGYMAVAAGAAGGWSEKVFV